MARERIDDEMTDEALEPAVFIPEGEVKPESALGIPLPTGNLTRLPSRNRLSRDDLETLKEFNQNVEIAVQSRQTFLAICAKRYKVQNMVAIDFDNGEFLTKEEAEARGIMPPQ